MAHNTHKTIAVVALAAVLLTGTFAVAQGGAQTGAVAPVPVQAEKESPWGPELGNVSLDESVDTLEAALISISKQAGFGLAITASEADLEKPLTLVIRDKPAAEVLDIIQTTTTVTLEMKNGILLVRSKSPDPQPTPEVAPVPKGRDRNGFADEHWRHRRNKRVEFGRPVTVEAGEHLHSAVSIGGTTTVRGHLDKDAVAVGGTVVVASGAVVEGQAVAIGGPVIVEPGAVVEDKVVSVGGEVQVADGAVVNGDQVSIPVPLPSAGGIAGAMGGILVLHFLSALARSVILFGLALLLVWLIPRRVEAVQGYMADKTGISILSGFLIFVALVPLILVLAITIIGIPLIPVVALALAALVVLGLSGLMAWLGYSVPLFKEGKTPVRAILIGFVAFTLINIIPVIGSLFLMIAVFAGVGAAFQSRFGGRPATG